MVILIVRIITWLLKSFRDGYNDSSARGGLHLGQPEHWDYQTTLQDLRQASGEHGSHNLYGQEPALSPCCACDCFHSHWEFVGGLDRPKLFQSEWLLTQSFPEAFLIPASSSRRPAGSVQRRWVWAETGKAARGAGRGVCCRCSQPRGEGELLLSLKESRKC